MEIVDSLHPQIASMPLHAITETLGTEGLAQRFSIEIGNFGTEEQQLANRAFVVASSLHAEDMRTREPYINHLVRVATRLMVNYRVTDINTVSSAVLHDSVEDHAADFPVLNNNLSSKDNALLVIADWFNPRVSQLVAAVTNPEFSPNRDKNSQYLEHLEGIVHSEDPWPLIIKLSDYTDNATGLIYTTGPKVPKLIKKYLPAIPIFRQGLERDDLPISADTVSHINSQLDLTEQRLLAA